MRLSILVSAIAFPLVFGTLACRASPERKALESQLATWSGPPARVDVQLKSAERDPERDLKYDRECRSALGKSGYVLTSDASVHVVVQLMDSPSPHRMTITSATRGVIVDEAVDRVSIKQLCALATQRGLQALQVENQVATAPSTAPAVTAPMPAETPTAPAAGGCVMDTECKGDRVCEAGVCVSPSNAVDP